MRERNCRRVVEKGKSWKKWGICYMKWGGAAKPNSMEPSHFWETASRSATQEFPKILRNPKVRYRLHKIPPVVPFLLDLSGSITLNPTSLRTILVLSSYLHLVFLLNSFFLTYLPKSCIHYVYPHACYVLRLSYPHWLYCNNIWRRVQITKLFIIQIFHTSYNLIPFPSNHLPQHPILKHPQSMFLL
jgi:hypothetical protein